MAEQRLSKIAKDCGVGVNTLTEFLKKKGYQGDVSPNAKIPEDFYAIIVKEYSVDQKFRKESERLSREKSSLEKRTISIEEDRLEEVALPEAPKEKPLEKPEEKSVSPKPPQEEAPVDFPVRQEPKILGKIDIDQLRSGKKVAEKKEPLPPVESTPPPKEEPAERIPEILPEVIPEKTITPDVEPPEIPKPEVVPASIPEEIVQPRVEKEIETEVPSIQIVAPEAPSLSPVPEAGAPLEISVPKEVVESKGFRVETPSSPVFKVVGKIELDKPRPQHAKKPSVAPPAPVPEKAKPTVESRKVEPEKAPPPPESPKVQPEAPVEANAPSETGPQEATLYRSPVQKLSGLTVVGKIDLASLEKKKPQPVASSDKDKQTKKKRKRIKPPQPDPQRRPTQGTNTQQPGQPGQGPQRPKPADASGNKNKKPAPKVVKPEITDEDVQKQIKDTLARLTTKTKSKGSKFRRQKRDDVRQRAIEAEERSEADRSILKIAEFATVNELATMMRVPVTGVISTCMSLGLFVSINQRLDAETISIVADEFGFSVQFASIIEEDSVIEEPDLPEDLRPRPPIVTVMGHVDHGKTSLLDYIRHANVIAGEAGGITQHIGAYSVSLASGRIITFLDTPGHEAFTAMRARGAQVTDIAIIVVAADDRVMPQTIEAINHASAANVPIVFAINKVDKPSANPDKIKEELANMNYLVEDWGGKYQSQEISAKYGTNVEDLLERVLLEADMLELKANPARRAYGTVIESSLDRGRGYVATVLVQNGTLKPGDIVLAGSQTGHVKALQNERGGKIKQAGPATPALLLGLDGAPQAGDKFQVMETEREAREIATRRTQLLREQGLRTQKHLTLEEIGRRIALGNFQEINVIVKGDVDGSVEALSDSLLKLSTQSIQVNIIHKAVGQISESDVNLAAASNAIIIGFQVRPSVNARKSAEKEQIDIRLYSVIYNAIEEMKDAMEGMLSPEIKEEIVATAEILEVFRITKVGNVAGCIVRDGKFNRNTRIRLIRDGIVVFQGELSSLKRHKEDVREVATGFECGMSIHNFNDIKEGDIIEGYTQVEVKRKL